MNLDRKHLTRRVPIVNEHGLIIGFTIEHRDGRQDAQIVLPRVAIKGRAVELR
jgi:hypothetical protein